MPSFFLTLILLLCFCEDFFFVQGSRGDTILQYTAPEDSGSSTDTWLLQPEGDSSLLLGATIDQKEKSLAPNTNTAAAASNFLSPNDKLLSETATTTSETESSTGGLLLGSSSNNDCGSSSTDDSTRESHQQTAAQQNPTKKLTTRRRLRRGEDASTTFCPLNSLPAPAPASAPENPSPQRKKKKTATKPKEPQPNGDTPDQVVPPTPSTADLNWNNEMYPSLFRIPADGYIEGGYNPTCIIKTNGLLPLGVCDSGDDKDRQNSLYDINGNLVDSGLFLDAVAFKLNHCRLGMCEEKSLFSSPFFFFEISNLIIRTSLVLFFLCSFARAPHPKEKFKKTHPFTVK